MEEFALDERLAADCLVVGDLPLCRVLLMDDTRFPWLILVPRRDGIREVYQLAPAEQQQLFAEATTAGERLMELSGGDKLNLAALGNIVPQLHMHVIARRADDPVWPHPVWGRGEAAPYPGADAEALIELLASTLSLKAVTA